MIDLDHAATSAIRESALLAMEPFLAGAGDPSARYGNPSGSHSLARDALRALDEARETVAGCIGCLPGEVIFTSGGTEANNQAISGGMPPRSNTVLCSTVEHHSVLDTTTVLGGQFLQVDRLGRIDLDALSTVLMGAPRIGLDIGLVSVMTANNEVGTINPIDAVAALVAECSEDVALHTDAVQAAPWLDLPEVVASAHMISVSAHKIGGPKGVGALVVRRGTATLPLIHGGQQERGLRGGTHNVAGIVGFAAAFAEVVSDRVEVSQRVSELRDQLADRLTEIHGVEETVGPKVARSAGLSEGRDHLLPGHCHLMVSGVNSEELLLLLEGNGVCASAASSCASGAIGSSHVVDSIRGVSAEGQADSAAVRLTLGSEFSSAMLDTVAEAFGASVSRARGEQ